MFYFVGCDNTSHLNPKFGFRKQFINMWLVCVEYKIISVIPKETKSIDYIEFYVGGLSISSTNILIPNTDWFSVFIIEIDFL